jgi:hypothetical protein
LFPVTHRRAKGMNYELAKKLADAGFPQQGNGYWVIQPDILVARRVDRVYVPTLSELIEACGEHFIMLNQHSSNSWGAVGGPHHDECGRTPVEAIARLWLTLNDAL